MRRRELLRLLAVAGLAGCAGIGSRDTTTSEAAAAAATPSPSTPTQAPPAPAPSPASRPSRSTTPADGPVVVAVGRGALGLPAPRAGGRPHRITGLAVHHTASPTGPASSAPARFRGIARQHRELGWVDAAYHWGVDVAGNVYQLRDESIAGDTNTGYDPAGWFLVVCEGNFEESAVPRPMLEAVADVLAVGARRHGVAASTLRGHRDLAATLCPGANLQARIGELRDLVAQRVAAGTTLRIDDDPARVAAIESG